MEKVCADSNLRNSLVKCIARVEEKWATATRNQTKPRQLRPMNSSFTKKKKDETENEDAMSSLPFLPLRKEDIDTTTVRRLRNKLSGKSNPRRRYGRKAIKAKCSGKSKLEVAPLTTKSCYSMCNYFPFVGHRCQNICTTKLTGFCVAGSGRLPVKKYKCSYDFGIQVHFSEKSVEAQANGECALPPKYCPKPFTCVVGLSGEVQANLFSNCGSGIVLNGKVHIYGAVFIAPKYICFPVVGCVSTPKVKMASADIHLMATHAGANADFWKMWMCGPNGDFGCTSMIHHWTTQFIPRHGSPDVCSSLFYASAEIYKKECIPGGLCFGFTTQFYGMYWKINSRFGSGKAGPYSPPFRYGPTGGSGNNCWQLYWRLGICVETPLGDKCHFETKRVYNECE
tara:strand:+ start:181 stop:1371 length:1191 start_codon:yes stop_codon:yes gene_type:complete